MGKYITRWGKDATDCGGQIITMNICDRFGVDGRCVEVEVGAAIEHERDPEATDNIEILGDGQDATLFPSDIPEWADSIRALRAARKAAGASWARYFAAAEGSDEEARLGAAHDVAEAAWFAAMRACRAIRDGIVAEVEAILDASKGVK